MNKIVYGLRAWLSQRLAPPGFHVHDSDQTACPHQQEVLVAALEGALRPSDDHSFMIDLRWDVDDVRDAGLIERCDPNDPAQGYQLTKAGERHLARLWGPGRVPPWSGGAYQCYEHGDYELAPGDINQCPGCSIERIIRRVNSVPATRLDRLLRRPLL